MFRIGSIKPIWDFGGQEIQHSTHQFFLTTRSLYLLVVDARKRGATSARKTVTRAVKTQLPQRLYQRVEQTAHQTGCGVSELIVSTLETRLPPLPDRLPPELAADLSRWSLLDDEALLAIANAFLPVKEQRRYTTLLRQANAGRLNPRARAEWDALQQEYLRFSRNKAKAQFLLAQRKRAAKIEGVPA
jgi:hypothetical protein